MIERWRPTNFGLPFSAYCYLTKPTISFYYTALGQHCQLGKPAISLSTGHGFNRTASHLSRWRILLTSLSDHYPPVSNRSTRRPLTCFVSFNFYALLPPGVPAQQYWYLAQLLVFSPSSSVALPLSFCPGKRNFYLLHAWPRKDHLAVGGDGRWAMVGGKR